MLKYFSTLELIILIIIFVPTVYAMIAGAPFVPTQMEQVNRMLKSANIKKGMRLYDLGSGDGRLVHKASKEYGAIAIGYEFSPLVYIWSKFLSIFWRSEAKLRYGNFWKQNFKDADIIVCYLLPYSMKNMRTTLIPQLKPGAIIVSHAFQIEGLKPWRSLPRLREKRLGPIWIYKIKEQRK